MSKPRSQLIFSCAVFSFLAACGAKEEGRYQEANLQSAPQLYTEAAVFETTECSGWKPVPVAQAAATCIRSLLVSSAPQLYSEKKVFEMTECSPHAPRWTVTVDGNVLSWDRRYFYGRSIESYRFNLANHELSHSTDVDIGDEIPAEEKVLPSSERAYQQGLQAIASTLDRVVKGYGCWKPNPEAQAASDYVEGLLN